MSQRANNTNSSGPLKLLLFVFSKYVEGSAKNQYEQEDEIQEKDVLLRKHIFPQLLETTVYRVLELFIVKSETVYNPGAF